MIRIDSLKNHPNVVPCLAKIWHELLCKKWAPEISLEQAEQRFLTHLNDDTLPLTYVAFDQDKTIGMCSLRENDGIRSDLKPWLGSLVVDKAYQGQGIARLLIDEVKMKAKSMHYKSVYLLTFDPTLPDYYQRLGWNKIGMDELKGLPVTVMQIEV